ncbi:MAG: DUF4428 domain-containing protein [Oscillospiraceae bacterium]|nr:DUF4428 domain-containing protein [Oscillospiraceae bacterium]
MAKHNCAICGAEIGLMSEQKLVDGNFICRKVCSKKTFKIFDKVSATLEDVTAHIEQIEKGTRIWNELLLPLKKAKNKDEKLKCFGVGGPLLYVSPSTGLIALVETRYKIFIFGKTQMACVYRLADLVQYDYEEEQVKNSEGKMETKEYCYLGFKETTGMSGFRLEVANSKSYESMAKYFDTLFGIQKTLGNSLKNAKRQMNAIKAFAGAVKAAKDGTLSEEQGADTIAALDASVYGDRTQWIAKADAALAPFQ